jgi:hypothetical protein
MMFRRRLRPKIPAVGKQAVERTNDSGRNAVGVLLRVASLAAALAVSACVKMDADHFSTTYLDQFATPNPTLAKFSECRGFGCLVVSHVSLSKEQWQRVVAVFKPPAKDAPAERQRIARAVALMQILVGDQTGTSKHQWTHKDLEILQNKGDLSQLDCIDEAVNTWTYMTLMEQAGLFRFHHVARLSHAGTLTDIRNTAVLQEKGGAYYAIDPSLVDVGVPPPIMPLATWLDHWPPDLPSGEAHS